MSDLTHRIEQIIADHVYPVTRSGDAWVEGIDEAAKAIADELELEP